MMIKRCRILKYTFSAAKRTLKTLAVREVKTTAVVSSSCSTSNASATYYLRLNRVNSPQLLLGPASQNLCSCCSKASHRRFSSLALFEPQQEISKSSVNTTTTNNNNNKMRGNNFASVSLFHLVHNNFDNSRSTRTICTTKAVPNRAVENMERDSPILFRQLFEHKSYTYTYLLACTKTKEALLIDPVLEMVPRDMKLVDQLGLTLKYAVNTHVHADHITGSGKLKQQLTGTKSVLGIDSGAKADKYLDHGEKLIVGDIEIEARKTPGHTNGCMTYIVHDQKCVFTGDAVLIRGCGRTDFQQGSSDRLYTSVHSQIFSLPEDYILYPAHDYTGQPWTTVGEEKKFNPRLTRTREEFIEIMEKLQLPYPKQIDRALPANLLCGIVDDEPPEAPK